ncbi:MAG: response regulator, partial [Haloferacaceae archaeon]
MPPEVRVIHVDDDRGFVELSSELLERADDRIEVRTETDPRVVTDAVLEFEPHCIVSDYEMPGMNGLDLFERIREADIEIPFILFTGKGSESIAAEAMTVGVTDYIQKGGTDTYELVANRVLDAVKSRQRKIAVDRAVNHYTALVETAHVPVYLYDEDGVIHYANEASARLCASCNRDFRLRRREPRCNPAPPPVFIPIRS